MLTSSAFISKCIKHFIFDPLNPLCGPCAKTGWQQPITTDQIARKIISATVSIDTQAQDNAAHDPDEAVLSRQEIAAHSLLSKDAYCDHLKEQLEQAIKSALGSSVNEATISKVAAHYAANFLGGELITGGDKKSQLDGFWPVPNYAIWQQLFQDLTQQIPDSQSDEAKIIANLAKGIDQLHRFSSDLAQLSAKPDVKPEEIYNVGMNYAQQIDSSP